MGRFWRKTVTIIGLVATGGLFSAYGGCEEAWLCLGADVLVDVLVGSPASPYRYGYYDSCYYQWSADDDGGSEEGVDEGTGEEAETQLFVTGSTGSPDSTGSGDEITLEYGPYEFVAHREAESGLYLFEPDPDGEISGAPITCSATINEEEIEGECERAESLCSFTYQREVEGEEGEFRGYDLVTTTCEEREGVGPFYLSD